jgi:hypothetical protein
MLGLELQLRKHQSNIVENNILILENIILESFALTALNVGFPLKNCVFIRLFADLNYKGNFMSMKSRKPACLYRRFHLRVFDSFLVGGGEGGGLRTPSLGKQY